MSTAPPRSDRVSFSLLQIFRGWAALLVVLVHATGITLNKYHTPLLGNRFMFGNAGVDFFFVLSGFLISYLHLGDIGRPARTRAYLSKRLVRIYPVYWLVTLAILPTYFLVANYGQGDETQPSVILGSLLLLPMSRAPILVAAWTLRHEMLFYLIFAVLIGLCNRWTLALVLAWVVAVLTSVGWSFHVPQPFGNQWMQWLLWPQNAEFLFGCAAAAITAKVSLKRVSLRWCGALLALALAAFALTSFLPAEFFDLKLGKHVLVYGTVCFVIVLTSTLIDRLGGLSDRWRRNAAYRGMQYLGDASYAIYLAHGPCLSVGFKLASSRHLIDKIGVVPSTWVVLAATVLIGCAFHSFAERPLLTFLRRWLVVRRTPGTGEAVPDPSLGKIINS